MKKYSVHAAAKRLIMSRSSLLKEVMDGRIVAHKRRYRTVFFEDDIEYYEKQNTINIGETTSNIGKNDLMNEQQILQNSQEHISH